MGRIGLIRLLAFMLPTIAAITFLATTRSMLWFALAPFAALLAGSLIKRAGRRFVSPEEVRADLEDRVRNPPI